MITIASRTQRTSRIARRNSYQDIGLSWVQVRKRDGTKNLTINKDSGIAQPTKWDFTSTSALSRGNLEAKRVEKYHSLQWRCCEYGTLVSNSSFRESDPYPCGRHGLVLSIRCDKRGKRTSRYSCGHWILTMVEPEEVEMLVSPRNLALGNKMHGDMSFRILEKRVHRHNCVKKPYSSIL